MKLRTATLIVAAIDLVAWAFVALATFASGSDAATRGLDRAAGLAVTALFLVTGVPALSLAVLKRAPAAALALALAFPAALAVAIVATIIAFA